MNFPEQLSELLATSQVTLTSAATAVAVPTTPNASRRELRVMNTHATAGVYYGLTDAVTNTTGHLIPANTERKFKYVGKNLYFYQNSGGNVTLSTSEWR